MLHKIIRPTDLSLPFPQTLAVFQFLLCPYRTSPQQLPVPNSTGYTKAAVKTFITSSLLPLLIGTVWCSQTVSARVSTCSYITYQTLRLDGSQKVHVHSHPHLQGPRLVPRQLPAVIPAGGDHSFQQLWTELAGVAEFWTGPAQKYGGYTTQHVCVSVSMLCDVTVCRHCNSRCLCTVQTGLPILTNFCFLVRRRRG